MNTHKFKAGDKVAIEGVVILNDDGESMSYEVELTSGHREWVDESDMSPVFDAAPQPSTEVNRTEILTRLVEAWIKKNGYQPQHDVIIKLSETVQSIIQLSKTPTND